MGSHVHGGGSGLCSDPGLEVGLGPPEPPELVSGLTESPELVSGLAGRQHVSVDHCELGGHALHLSSDVPMHPCEESWALSFGHQLYQPSSCFCWPSDKGLPLQIVALSLQCHRCSSAALLAA